MDKMRDPYAEYMAAREVSKAILNQISAVQAYDPDSVEVQAKLTQLSVALVKAQEIRDEARKQYNETASEVNSYLREGIDAAQDGNIQRSIVCLLTVLHKVLQHEPIPEENDNDA